MQNDTDWVFTAFFSISAALLTGTIFWRWLKEYRLWRVLSQPFRQINDIFERVKWSEDSVGHIMLENGKQIKRVATFAGTSGVVVRKLCFPIFFPTFEIRWDQVSNVFFAETLRNDRFGLDALGMAKITLNLSEQVVLVLPWRQNFNKYLPDRIGYQDKLRTQ